MAETGKMLDAPGTAEEKVTKKPRTKERKNEKKAVKVTRGENKTMKVTQGENKTVEARCYCKAPCAPTLCGRWAL